MKKLLLLVMALVMFTLSLTGCNNESDKLIGIWMHVKESLPGTIHHRRYYSIIEFTENTKTSFLSDDRLGVSYEITSGQVNIIDAATKKTIMVATDITSDSVTLKDMERGGETNRYDRITREQAMEIKERINAAR